MVHVKMKTLIYVHERKCIHANSGNGTFTPTLLKCPDWWLDEPGTTGCAGERLDGELGMGSQFVYAKIDLRLGFPNPTRPCAFELIDYVLLHRSKRVQV